jgi:hypothetical protein
MIATIKMLQSHGTTKQGRDLPAAPTPGRPWAYKQLQGLPSTQPHGSAPGVEAHQQCLTARLGNSCNRFVEG